MTHRKFDGRANQVGGYVLDSGGVMLSGYDGKRQAYDTAGDFVSTKDIQQKHNK